MTGELEWKAERRRRAKAIQQASEVLEAFELASQAPVDPFALVEAETAEGLLVARGGDFGGAFDGQLEFLPRRARFLLLYNTRYERPSSRLHQPRTRFSVAHELGHYYLEPHNAYLRGGGPPHPSRSEFRRADSALEREADSFATGLLMPKRLMSPLVNRAELTLERIEELAATFQTSRVSTTIRSVLLSHFPCAVLGIREGRIAWCFCSEALVRGACYPRRRGAPGSPRARRAWSALSRGAARPFSADGPAVHWLDFRRRHLSRLQLTEHYLPVPVMRTLVVLLTLDERDVFGA